MAGQTAIVGSRRTAPPPVPAPDLSWLRHLPESSRAAFLSEINTAVEAGDWKELNQLMVSWRATAEVYADPELLTKIANPEFEDRGQVARP
jgi:hypothetical protein